MAYSINPNLINARKEALLAVISRGMPVCVAARRYGVHRSTIWRWVRRWRELNPQISLRNYNRPLRPYSLKHHLIGATWTIPTCSSAPKSHPRRIAEWIVRRIVELREAQKRCAVVIHHLLLQEGIKVCISTVERVIAKFCALKTKRRQIRRTLPRPDVKAPGDLVEMDTVHYVNKLNGERKYIFTVIDLCSRMAHARCFDRLLPSGAVKTLAEAEQFFGFPIRTVQTDNGPEFGRWFTDRVQVELLDGDRRVHRHTRIHRPNDNAHIERFNRTLREECIGVHMDEGMTAEDISWELLSYLDHYNNVRIHLGVQCRTPRQQANKTVG